MKTTAMIVVAVVALGWSVSVRGDEAGKADAHQPGAKGTVKLERACGSCHSANSFIVAGAEFHSVHPWSLVNVTGALTAHLQEPAETVKAAFLGVGVEKPSETLRAQLGLQEGVGLVVNFLEENAPAKGAGLRQHDVLHRFDDQLLVNEEQLVTLVRLKKPGEAVTLEVIRAGKARDLTVRLGEKQVAAASMLNFVDIGRYDAVLDRRTLLLGNPTTQPAGGRGLVVTLDSSLAPYAKVLDRSVSVGPITVDDGSHVIIYTPNDGGVLVAMEEDSGAILFNGPVATDEQWQAVPANVKEKLQELHESFRRGKQGTGRREARK
jgi:hypothetical protein